MAHYGGYFDYFFTVSEMDLLREEDTGEFSPQHSPTTTVSLLHVREKLRLLLIHSKLLIQLVLAVASFVLSIFYFTKFKIVFPCPRNSNTADPLWPLPMQVNCVFASLKLLYMLQAYFFFYMSSWQTAVAGG